MSPLVGTLFVISLISLVSGWFVRVRIFIKMETDHVAAPLLEDTSVLSFGDLLWIYLYRKRHEIAPEFRRVVTTYFWLTFSATVSMVAMFAVHWLAA